MKLLLLIGALALLSTPISSAESPMIRPPELERDVHFWIRVYSEISTSEGFLHDEHNLGVVYVKMKFRTEVTPAERRDAIDSERSKIETMLRHLASGATDLSDDEKKIAASFGDEASPSRFTQASNEIRFQLGQADRFREGLERSGAWESHIADAFAALGLPPELAALPHVESSFDPTAYSKVGAAGLWQFMRSTGRRFLRIDDAVDERMDPFRATEAAAQLLDFNYRLLGTWPLALTAYNHGAAGMRRARDSMATDDIAKIVRQYRSPTFGFASRNFYVSFLAALEIDRNPEKYFGDFKRRPGMRFAEIEMPSFVPLSALQRVLRIDRPQLEKLNPALRPPVLNGQRMVPAGYRLRLPIDAGSWTPQLLAAQLGQKDQYLGQPRARSYRVRKGDTLEQIARAQNVGVAELARLNGLSDNDRPRERRVLRLPELPPQRIGTAGSVVAANNPPAAAAAPVPAPAPSPSAAEPVSEQPNTEPRPAPVIMTAQVSEALQEQRAEKQVVHSSERPKEQISGAEARAEGPSLVPGGAVAQASDPVEYEVAANDSVHVAADETLGHYADWLSVTASRLRKLNGMKPKTPVIVGRVVKLDFSRVTHDQFEQKRRAYHEELQAAYFTTHRIVGTEVYVARRGDSLWVVAQRFARLPSWLVQQYNPDIDFADLRAGVQVVVPKVEAVPPT